MHGGRIDAHSDGPGKGSEFVVRLPVVITQPSPGLHPANDDARKPSPAAKYRILIVDDN